MSAEALSRAHWRTVAVHAVHNGIGVALFSLR